MNEQIRLRPNGEPVPSVANVRRMCPMGWGHFKHQLVAAGVIASPDDDCPVAWQMAFTKFFRGR